MQFHVTQTLTRPTVEEDSVVHGFHSPQEDTAMRMQYPAAEGFPNLGHNQANRGRLTGLYIHPTGSTLAGPILPLRPTRINGEAQVAPQCCCARASLVGKDSGGGRGIKGNAASSQTKTLAFLMSRFGG